MGFIFGGDTGETAQSLADKRQYAQSLLAQSMGNRQIQHPLQGVNQIAQALMGGYLANQNDKAMSQGGADATAKFTNSIGADSGDYDIASGTSSPDLTKADAHQDAIQDGDVPAPASSGGLALPFSGGGSASSHG